MAKSYKDRREQSRDILAKQRLVDRDLGEIPPCADPELVEEISKNFRLFCEVCLPDWFFLEWSEDHLKTIAKIEGCILRGEVFALAMPRASGKSSLIKAALLWAILHGYRRYVVLVAADKGASDGLLESLKTQFETNQKLLELYPEACVPVRPLSGNPQRAASQLLNGKRTHIVWRTSKCVLASVPGAKCSGAVIETFGIFGRIRGANHSLSNGESIRPDLFMIDDPQTDKSAETPSQVNKRLSVANGAILGLAGPGKSIAGFAAVTVIREDDMADRLLNQEEFPDWSGERFKLVYQWPTSKEAIGHWEHYGLLRAEGLRSGKGLAEASSYYVENREAMDEGAKVAWESRYNQEIGEVSALQHAFNLRFKSPETFDAEYQNTPTPPESDVQQLTARQIEAKVNGYSQGVLPIAVDLITAYVDVQGKALYWLVCGWESATFSGFVMDYGTWPKQNAKHYNLRTLSKTLGAVYPGGFEARLRAGLFNACDYLAGRQFRTVDDQRSLKVQAIGIDAAWGPSTKLVQSAAIEHPKGAMLFPSFGRGLKPSDVPMQYWSRKPGERKGQFFILRPTQGGGRHLIIDTNAAKSFVNARLTTPQGDPGSLSLFKPAVSTEHRMLGEHLTAERVQNVSIDGGRSGEVWSLLPAKPDNHFWDCLVGSSVIASLCGATLNDNAGLPRRKLKRKKPRSRVVLKMP